MPVDVIAVGAEPALSAVTRATKTIPIVVVSVDDDLVATGLVKSLSRPGGNITGISALQSDLAAKRLELLRDAIPRLARVAVFWDPLNRRGVSDMKQRLARSAWPYDRSRSQRHTTSMPPFARQESQKRCGLCRVLSRLLYPTWTACECRTHRPCTYYASRQEPG